jgi:hypothetical protein
MIIIIREKAVRVGTPKIYLRQEVGKRALLLKAQQDYL